MTHPATDEDIQTSAAKIVLEQGIFLAKVSTLKTIVFHTVQANIFSLLARQHN